MSDRSERTTSNSACRKSRSLSDELTRVCDFVPNCHYSGLTQIQQLGRLVKYILFLEHCVGRLAKETGNVVHFDHDKVLRHLGLMCATNAQISQEETNSADSLLKMVDMLRDLSLPGVRQRVRASPGRYMVTSGSGRLQAQVDRVVENCREEPH